VSLARCVVCSVGVRTVACATNRHTNASLQGEVSNGVACVIGKLCTVTEQTSSQNAELL